MFKFKLSEALEEQIAYAISCSRLALHWSWFPNPSPNSFQRALHLKLHKSFFHFFLLKWTFSLNISSADPKKTRKNTERRLVRGWSTRDKTFKTLRVCSWGSKGAFLFLNSFTAERNFKERTTRKVSLLTVIKMCARKILFERTRKVEFLWRKLLLPGITELIRFAVNRFLC